MEWIFSWGKSPLPMLMDSISASIEICAPRKTDTTLERITQKKQQKSPAKDRGFLSQVE